MLSQGNFVFISQTDWEPKLVFFFVSDTHKNLSKAGSSMKRISKRPLAFVQYSCGVYQREDGACNIHGIPLATDTKPGGGCVHMGVDIGQGFVSETREKGHLILSLIRSGVIPVVLPREEPKQSHY